MLQKWIPVPRFIYGGDLKSRYLLAYLRVLSLDSVGSLMARSMLSPVLVAAVLGLTMGVLAAHAPVQAQSDLSDCATRTATNASLLLPADLEVILGDSKQRGPWHISVITPEGHCAGWVRWSGEATTLTAWGTTASLPVAPSDSALAPGDSLRFRLYHPSTNSTYTSTNSRITVSFQSDQSHLTVHRRYVAGGIYVLDQIHVQGALVSRQE
jgi:hypothetical protein